MTSVYATLTVIALFLVTAPAHSAPGVSIPPEDQPRYRYTFSPPVKDTLTPFTPTFFGGPTPPPSRVDLEPWALNLDARLVARVDSLDYETYMAFRDHQRVTENWNGQVRALLRQSESERRGELRMTLALPSAVESIVGEGGAGLKVSGYRKILFTGRSQWTDQASTSTVKQSKFPSLSMEQISRFTVEGNIGSKISVKVDQDSKRTADLDNRIIIRYKGDEDDILQSVDLGNTTLSLSDAKFVGYSERIQGLFGIGAGAKLGPIDMKLIASQEKGNTSTARVTAGASEQNIIIRDYNYERYRMFDLGVIGGEKILLPGDTIVDFILYQGVSNTDIEASRVRLYDNLQDSSLGATPVDTRARDIVISEYLIDYAQHYIYFPRRVQSIENTTLAYYLSYVRNGEVFTIGQLSQNTNFVPHRLQYLKKINPKPDDGFWEAERKNVYDLRIRNIQYEDLDFDIHRGGLGDEENPSNLNHQGGQQYIKLLGLDVVNSSGSGVPDGKIDDNPAILDMIAGLVIFPDPFPFASDVLDETAPGIYNQALSKDRQDSSKYYIRITTRQRSSQVRLGTVNILPGSEVVTYNNVRLNRGSDYDVDYELGTITFRRDDVLDPDANITIDYEYAPFLTVERRALFGASATFDGGRNFRTGATFLYKGTKATDRPAQLGQEPFRDIVGEVFLNWRAEPKFLTSFANALPMIQTEANSYLDIQTAAARSFPNPNTRGEVFVDDFEGAKRAYSLGVLRESWTIASPPLASPGGDDYRRNRVHDHGIDSLGQRLFKGLNDPGFSWFNPYTQFDDTDIYERDPNRQHGTDRRTHVLVLESRPYDSPTRDEKSDDPKTAWAGIMRGLPAGVWNQSRAEFIELRMAVASRGSDPGTLHLDLGRITEDVNLNGEFDTEDHLDSVTQSRNRILEDGEDIGLDALTDQQEVRWWDGARYHRDTLPDPAGDNWPAEVDDSRTRSEHPRVNGTDGNYLDPVVGQRPNTEDIGGESESDWNNAYYQFTVAMDVYAADPSRIQNSAFTTNDDPTRFAPTLTWYTYRIPLWDARRYEAYADAGQNPDSNDIQFARLWIEGVDTTTRVYIAAIDIIERTWDARLKVVDSVVSVDAAFELGVVNTEENSSGDTGYVSPPGVSGYRDPRSGFREKEQSLLLAYDNFRSNDSGTAAIVVAKEDYTGYRYLEMWANHHSQTDARTGYYLRFGQSTTDYYEYADTLTYDSDPIQNWRNNAMKIDFDKLTALKDTKNRTVGMSGYLFDPETKLGVKGNPSLSNITYRQLGVVRFDDSTLSPHSGEIWFDDLRLTEVRRDAGLAATGRMTMQLADLGGFTAVVEGRNYAFRGLTQGRTSSVVAGASQLKTSLNGNLSVDRFLPPVLGVSLPVTASYSKSTSEPRLLTGSDIVLTPERRTQETSTSISRGFSTRLSIRPRTDNWIINSTLGSIGTRFATNRSQTWSPTVPFSESDRYDAGADYRLKIANRLTFPALYWTRLLFLPRRIWGTPFSLLPQGFDAQGTVRRDRSMSINSQGELTQSYRRDFQGTASTTLQPISPVQISYAMTTNRDLADPERLNLSLNPRNFRLGTETNFTQRLSSSYRPSLFSFLSPSLTYNANFRDDIDKQYGDHDVSLDRNWVVSSNFDVDRFWTALMIGSQARTPARPRRGPTPARPTPGTPQQTDTSGTAVEQPKPKGPGLGVGSLWNGLIKGFRFVTSPIKPLNVSYSESDGANQQNLLERPDRLYQFGLSDIDQLFARANLSNQSLAQQDRRTHRNSVTVKNTINFLGILDFGSSYSKAKSTTRQGGSSPTFTDSETFPSLTTSLSRLERFKPIGWVFRTASARFGYSQTNDETRNSLTTSRQKGETYSPLFAIQGTTPQQIQLNFSLDRSSTITDNSTSGQTKRASRQVRVTANYAFSSPNGIPLPFLRSIRLKSRMSLAVTVTHKVDESFTDPGGQSQFALTQRTADMTVSTRANYSFSSRVTGGLSADWTDRDTEGTSGNRKTHIRALSIWAEFSF